ncbi:MAG: hypothetical protein GY874_02110 [Desulfobacteraceae bacterium]|nr:hypothetical protein [Desulfobacteraceae bacterium]
MWSDLESLVIVNNCLLIIAMISATAAAAAVLLLWINGNRMISFLIGREKHAGKHKKIVEKAAEQIRKELLKTQQDQDIINQKRRLAEMDADTLRKEMEQIRQRYKNAEGALKVGIDKLKGIKITQTKNRKPKTEAEPELELSEAEPELELSEAEPELELSEAEPELDLSEAEPELDLSEAEPELDTQLGIHIDKKQSKMLANLLDSGPKGELDIIAILDNAESNEIAMELKQLFDKYGWTTRGIIQSAFSKTPKGISLVIHSKQTTPSYAKFVQRSLTTIGIPVSLQINSKFKEWSISLIVGTVH